MATRPISNFLLVAAVSVLWLATVPSWGRTLSQGGEETARREEREDYFRSVDQSTQEPSIRVSYRITRGAETPVERVDEEGESIQLFSQHRLVLIKGLPLQDLKPGRYRLSVQVRDRIKGQQVEKKEEFQVKALPQWASRP